jgi:hypothetical protein
VVPLFVLYYVLKTDRVWMRWHNPLSCSFPDIRGLFEIHHSLYTKALYLDLKGLNRFEQYGGHSSHHRAWWSYCHIDHTEIVICLGLGVICNCYVVCWRFILQKCLRETLQILLSDKASKQIRSP